VPFVVTVRGYWCQCPLPFFSVTDCDNKKARVFLLPSPRLSLQVLPGTSKVCGALLDASCFTGKYHAWLKNLQVTNALAYFDSPVANAATFFPRHPCSGEIS